MASEVWVFNNGVTRLVENPGGDEMSNTRQKILVHIPSNKVITSYSKLEEHLTELGWERYNEEEEPDLIQFRKESTDQLISLPSDFSKFKSMHMYDVVIKNRNMFEVRSM